MGQLWDLDGLVASRATAVYAELSIWPRLCFGCLFNSDFKVQYATENIYLSQPVVYIYVIFAVTVTWH